MQVVISVQEVSHVATAHLEFCGRALTARSQLVMQTDLAGTVWRDDMWLTTYPLNAQVADWGLFAVWFHLLSGLNCNVGADSNRLLLVLTILGSCMQQRQGQAGTEAARVCVLGAKAQAYFRQDI